MTPGIAIVPGMPTPSLETSAYVRNVYASVNRCLAQAGPNQDAAVWMCPFNEEKPEAADRWYLRSVGKIGSETSYHLVSGTGQCLAHDVNRKGTAAVTRDCAALPDPQALWLVRRISSAGAYSIIAVEPDGDGGALGIAHDDLLDISYPSVGNTDPRTAAWAIG